jgi:hypothetical protein
LSDSSSSLVDSRSLFVIARSARNTAVYRSFAAAAAARNGGATDVDPNAGGVSPHSLGEELNSALSFAIVHVPPGVFDPNASIRCFSPGVFEKSGTPDSILCFRPGVFAASDGLPTLILRCSFAGVLHEALLGSFASPDF